MVATLVFATGWTVEHIWTELPYSTAVALYEWLPNHRLTNQFMASRLAYSFESFAGGKPGEFNEWLPGFMRPTDENRQTRRAFFSEAVVRDVDLAFDLGFLSQAALAALGPKRLRESGAFAPDRNTDTTIH